MEDQKNNRIKLLQVRLTTAEHHAILKTFSKTTSRKLSDYVRKIILGKPHIGKIRNESLDDFVTVLAQLKMELKAAGNNLNQAVKKLHSLNQGGELEQWLISWELGKRTFQKSVDAITRHLDKINDEWFR
ncbi:plasmid mobilization protein [Pedobacter jeongneungensis]|uniref:plasmid mobilization protein n=1 Tax=Pedobacter jeongneungensis TaxID=947309 RepID=UPI00046AABAF|nr:hypothetical protein [Pedobacter jeongneungensis]